MRVSQLFTKTTKTVPADETAKNAQLLIQAGYVHKEMAGVYDYLPLGWRVIEKIKQIVREEMDRAGSQELTMSVLQPSQLWEKTDRWDDDKVDNWFKTYLSNGTQLGVGLTHEEPIVGVAKKYIASYKDLPKNVYQMGNKFRNEKRAKSGILRGREFIMKDAYSFSRDQAQHDEVYEAMATAYHKVYERLGLGDVTVRVKADGGIFTERFSDEFQTISPIGEDTIFHVPGSDLYYNQEVAPSQAPAVEDDEQPQAASEVEGVGIIGVESLAKHLGIAVEKTTKTLIYETADGRVIAAAVRGGYDVNEVKLRKAVSAEAVFLASPETVERVTGAKVGYAGLNGLADDVEIIVDESCKGRVNFEMGANKTDYHLMNLNWGRDVVEPEQFYDIKEAKTGDSYPENGQVYEVHTAVEVGNIFPLETKYTKALDVYYSDEAGQRQEIIMGSYGIGVSRLMGIIAEHFADDKGLVWPKAIAPYQVYLVAIGEAGTAKADELYEQLQTKGIEVLYDDRKERPGTKFADSELLGIPQRITVSDRLVESEQFEYSERTSEQKHLLTHDELLGKLN